LYFATVKLIYTVGYGVSLLSLSVAVIILLLFRYCAWWTEKKNSQTRCWL